MIKLQKNINLIFLFYFFSDLKFYSAVAVILFSAIAGSYTLGMAVFSIISLTSVLSELPTGVISDFIGRKRTMTCGVVFSLLGIALFSTASSFLLLALGAVSLGIGNSFYTGNNAAILFETLKEGGKLDQHHKLLGRQHSIGYISMAVGSLACALMLLSGLDMRYLLWLSIVPQVVALVITLFIQEPNVVVRGETNLFSHLRQAIGIFRKNRKLKFLTLAFMGDCSIGYASYEMMIAMMGAIIPTWFIGFYYAAVCSLGAVGAYVSSRIIRLSGYLRGFVWGTLLVGLLRLSAAVLASILSPIFFAFGQLFYSVIDASHQHLMQMEYSDKERATIGSMTSLLCGVAWAVISVLSGVLADLTSPSFALVALVLLWISRVFLYKAAMK